MLTNFYNEYSKKSEIKKFKKNLYIILIISFLLFYLLLCFLLLKIKNIYLFISVIIFLLLYILLCAYLVFLIKNGYNYNYKLSLSTFRVITNLKKVFSDIKNREKILIINILKKYNLYSKEKIKFILDIKNDYNKNNEFNKITVINVETIITIIISSISLCFSIANTKYSLKFASYLVLIILIIVFTIIMLIYFIKGLKSIIIDFKEIDYEILDDILKDIYVEMEDNNSSIWSKIKKIFK